jgi:hypothetical protein
MDKDVWGPSMWTSIHAIALHYPDAPTRTDKKNYRNYFKGLGDVLPCDVCSNNYALHLLELPVEDYLDSKDKLFEWTVKLHNFVNKDLNKPQMTVADAKQALLHPASQKYEDVLLLASALGGVLLPVSVFCYFRLKRR